MLNQRRIILITGASGYIGKNLHKYLQEKKYKTRLMIRMKSFSDEAFENTEIMYGDLRDLNSLIKATKEIYAVVNLAARKADEKDSFDVNVRGVKNLIKACQVNNVRKIIQISSVSAKINKKGLYGKTKELGDEVIAQSKIPYVILRVSLVYGGGSGGIFASLIRASKLPVIPVFGDGKWVSNPIHVRDLSKTIERAIANDNLKNQTWDVGGKEGISFDDLIRKLSALYNRKPLILHIPASFGLFFAKAADLLLEKPPISVSNILGSTQNVTLNLNKYFRDFQIVPRFMDEGLKEIVNEKNNYSREVEIISNYILSTSDIRYQSDSVTEKNYLKILKSEIGENKDKFSALAIKYPFLISPIESYLKIFSLDAVFLKKIYILSALLECSPLTADWLLPSEESKLTVLKKVLWLGVRISFKYFSVLLAAPFLFIYEQNKKNT